MGQPGKNAGDFGDPAGLNQYTEEMRMKEINNGRMAMISVLGIFGAELATGKDALTQFSALPARSEASRVTMFAEAEAKAPFQPADQLGAMAPLGYFDPAGFAKVGDEAGFKNLRAAELKHGRVAMMAAVGAVARSLFRFPGFEDVKGTFTAIGGGEGVLAGTAAIFVLSGVLEQVWTEQPGKNAGDFGDPAGLNQYTEEMRMKEINNGRMAMISVLGIFGAELATGKDALTQFSALPSRSEASRVTMFAEAQAGTFQPADQLGAMAPLGYFDPLGFAKVGDEAGFKNLRAAELKHGRVAMMAAVGAVAQGLFRFPGLENVKGTFTAAGSGDVTAWLAALFVISGGLE